MSNLFALLLIGFVALLVLGALCHSPQHHEPPTNEHRPHNKNVKPAHRSAPRSRPSAASFAPRPKPNPHLLDARKALHAFDFILKSFGRQPPWSGPKQLADYVHDLAVMLDHGDLQTASLELIAPDHAVLFRHRIEFRTADRPAGVDAAGGIELPLIPAHKIATHRILVAPVRRLAEYAHRLRCRWTNAEHLPDRPGSRFTSEHTRRTNADRMTGQVFVSNDARHTATIVTVSPGRDYAFARHAAFPVDVYLHRAQCDQPLTFEPGARVSFVVIQTPHGLQGRNIRPA